MPPTDQNDPRLVGYSTGYCRALYDALERVRQLGLIAGVRAIGEEYLVYNPDSPTAKYVRDCMTLPMNNSRWYVIKAFDLSRWEEFIIGTVATIEEAREYVDCHTKEDIKYTWEVIHHLKLDVPSSPHTTQTE